MKDMGVWFYKYDEDIGSLEEGVDEGAMGTEDVEKVINQLKKNPNKLRDKPGSIEYLEKLTRKKATRKFNSFGKWHIYEYQKWSAFNNPFHISLGYTRNADEFEIWFIEQEEEPRKYQTINDITEALRKFGYIEN